MPRDTFESISRHRLIATGVLLATAAGGAAVGASQVLADPAPAKAAAAKPLVTVRHHGKHRRATHHRRHVAHPHAHTTAAPATSHGYSIPASIVMCESGGNYHAVNPSSGAGGAYQILPSTWAAYGGTGLPQDAPPAEQDAIAAKIYAAGGPSQWSCG